jgi:hypothetical protein
MQDLFFGFFLLLLFLVGQKDIGWTRKSWGMGEAGIWLGRKDNHLSGNYGN